MSAKGFLQVDVVKFGDLGIVTIPAANTVIFDVAGLDVCAVR